MGNINGLRDGEDCGGGAVVTVADGASGKSGCSDAADKIDEEITCPSACKLDPVKKNIKNKGNNVVVKRAYVALTIIKNDVSLALRSRFE